MKFVAVMVFTARWLANLSLCSSRLLGCGPMAGSWLGWGAIDLAGGIVVHATAGVSALVLAKMIGPRRGFPKQLQPPHSPGLVMIGASLLWVGWFGFNAGSQGGSQRSGRDDNASDSYLGCHSRAGLVPRRADPNR